MRNIDYCTFKSVVTSEVYILMHKISDKNKNLQQQVQSIPIPWEICRVGNPVSQHACASFSSQEMRLLMEMSHRQHGPLGSLINLVSDNQQSSDPAFPLAKFQHDSIRLQSGTWSGCETSHTKPPLEINIYITSISHKYPNVQYNTFISFQMKRKCFVSRVLSCSDHIDLFLLKLQAKGLGLCIMSEQVLNCLSYPCYDLSVKSLPLPRLCICIVAAV